MRGKISGRERERFTFSPRSEWLLADSFPRTGFNLEEEVGQGESRGTLSWIAGQGRGEQKKRSNGWQKQGLRTQR